MFNKIKDVSKNVIEKTKQVKIKKPNVNLKTSPVALKVVKLILIFAILALGIIEIVFGAMIYFAKADDQITKSVSKYIPFPAVYTSSGIVTTHDYFHEMDYINHFYSATDQSGIDQGVLGEQIMLQLIENKIIADEAAKFKIRVTDAEIDKAFAEIIEENGGESEVNKVLNDLYGLNSDEFKKLIEVQLLRDKVNDGALTQVRAKHILVRLDDGADENAVNEAKTKIDGYWQEIKDGLDFAEAANKYSEDVGSNEKGGDLGFFGRGEMISEFEEVAYSTPVGEISEPFRTSFGWHIVKVEEKSGEIDKSFTEWLKEIKEKTIIVDIMRI